jgi:release factor glutamine methyltransferase
MNSMSRAGGSVDITGAAGATGALGRGFTPHGPFRRFLRRFIHFFAYHLILARRRTRITQAAGFRLTVPPTVFHPRYFLSSECFAEFISHLDLSGKRVVDVGTGSGILALAAARAGAENVIAADINPNAAVTAGENARANGVGDQVSALCSDLLSALAPRPLFDVILSSPPKHAGEPRDLADRGWHAGPRYRDVAALFDQSRARLKPEGRLYVMVSSDTDLDLFGKLIDRAGFRAELAHERSIFIESFIIYELFAHRRQVQHQGIAADGRKDHHPTDTAATD